MSESRTLCDEQPSVPLPARIVVSLGRNRRCAHDGQQRIEYQNLLKLTQKKQANSCVNVVENVVNDGRVPEERLLDSSGHRTTTIINTDG